MECAEPSRPVQSPSQCPSPAMGVRVHDPPKARFPPSVGQNSVIQTSEIPFARASLLTTLKTMCSPSLRIPARFGLKQPRPSTSDRNEAASPAGQASYASRAALPAPASLRAALATCKGDDGRGRLTFQHSKRPDGGAPPSLPFTPGILVSVA